MLTTADILQIILVASTNLVILVGLFARVQAKVSEHERRLNEIDQLVTTELANLRQLIIDLVDRVSSTEGHLSHH